MTYTSPFFSNTTGYSGEVGLLDDFELVGQRVTLFQRGLFDAQRLQADGY